MPRYKHKSMTDSFVYAYNMPSEIYIKEKSLINLENDSCYRLRKK